jgi:hypothetical protein
MRKPSVIKGLKNSQKIFLAINGVAMYTTVGATDNLARTTQRSAVYVVLAEMVDQKAIGISRTVRVYDHKMEPVSVEVSISKC